MAKKLTENKQASNGQEEARTGTPLCETCWACYQIVFFMLVCVVFFFASRRRFYACVTRYVTRRADKKNLQK